jgi:sugar phosphate permease
MLSFGHGATHWIAGTLYILLPVLKENLGLSYAQAGLFLSTFHVCAFGANFVSGFAVDVSGRQVLLQVGALIGGALAIVVFGMSSAYLVLIAMAGLMGASNQAWHPGALAYLSARYPRNRGYALSIHASGANIGDALAPMAAGALLVWATWRTTAMMGALPAMLAALVLAVTLLPAEKPNGAAGSSGMSARSYFIGYWALLRDRAVMGLTLTAGFRTMAQTGLFTLLPLYISDVMGQGTVFMGTAMMMIQIGGIVAAPLAGVWSDRIGRRRIVFGALGLSTVAIFVLTLVKDQTLYVGCISLLGFFLFAIRPVVQSWMMDLVPPSFAGSATSLMFGVQAVLGALTPLIGGVMADRYGLLAVFYMLTGIMLLANILALLVPRREPR